MFENIAESRDRQSGLLKILPDLSQTQHRLADPARQHIERDKFSDAQAAIDHQPGAEIKRRAVASLLTNCTLWLAILPRLVTRKLAVT